MFNFSKAKLFLIFSLVFILGIFIAFFLPVSFLENRLFWFVGIAISTVFFILFFSNKHLKLLSLIFLALFLGIWRYSFSLADNSLDKVWHYNEENLTLKGLVSTEPDVRDNNVKYVIEMRPDYFVQGKVLVTTNLYPRYNYGDILEINCELKAPEKFNDFSYDRYLARFNIYSVCYYPQINLVDKNQGNWLYTKVFELKNLFRGIIDSGLSEPEASLARALVLGDKKGIPEDLRDSFSKTGISHIMAISGMHISILAGVVMFIFLGIGLYRKHAFYLATIFLILYLLLIGLPASAMRAGLMGFLVLFALNLGRFSKLTNSIILAATVLLFINPKLLRDDIGFQLSFLAVLSIAYFYPIVERGLEKIKIPKMRGVRDILSITIAAQIFTFPIITLNFSQVSLIAPLTNLLVLWTLPILMFFIIGAVILSLIFPGISFLFFLPAGILLNYIIIIVNTLLKIPFAYFSL